MILFEIGADILKSIEDNIAAESLRPIREDYEIGIAPESRLKVNWKLVFYLASTSLQDDKSIIRAREAVARKMCGAFWEAGR